MMTEYKCVVCKMPMLVLEDKIGNGDTPIGRCVHSNCVMSSIWLPIEALDEIERLQSEREQTCKWIKTRIGKQVGLHNHFYISCIKENRLCDDIEVTYCKYCGKKVEYVEES